MSTNRPPTVAQLRYLEAREQLRPLDLAGRFARIYETNLWGAGESRSGLGSEAGATAVLRAALPPLLRELEVATILDLPCGDFGWLRRIPLPGVDYLGADIVPGIVARNSELFGKAGRAFAVLDLTRDRLPRADLVLCRDCLVHFSFDNVHRGLRSIVGSGSRYLLTTTFPAELVNQDIEDGDWRPLNLCALPFGLPTPMRLINERCTEADGAYGDKSLGLWEIASLRCVVAAARS